MSVPTKYCWYVRSPTTCTRYDESWRPQYYRCLGACEGLNAVRESNDAYNIVDTNVDAYNTVCQGGCGALFPQAYRVWSLVSWFNLCAAFSVRPWSLPSGHPWSDGTSRASPCQSEKSGKQASYGSPVGDAGSE